MASGVLIFEGMEVGVLPGDFKISLEDSGGQTPELILSTAYNVLPIWLRIAHDNLHQSKIASEKVVKNWSENGSINKELLVSELEPSLLVIVSCGIALDVLFDMLRPHAKLTNNEIEKWYSKKCNRRTGRAKQISEVIRRVYNLDNLVFKQFKANITEIIKFRNWAVHPSVKLKRSCTRPDIPVGVDWKFSAYRFSNSEICYKKMMQMLIYLYEKKCKNVKVVDQFDNIIKALIELGVLVLKNKT